MTDKITIRVSPEIKQAADEAGPERVRGILYAGLSTTVSTNSPESDSKAVGKAEILRLSTKVAQLEEQIAKSSRQTTYSPTLAKSTFDPPPFKVVPWDHDDWIRHHWNIFRRPIEDRDACLAILSKTFKGLKPASA